MQLVDDKIPPGHQKPKSLRFGSSANPKQVRPKVAGPLTRHTGLLNREALEGCQVHADKSFLATLNRDGETTDEFDVMLPRRERIGIVRIHESGQMVQLVRGSVLRVRFFLVGTTLWQWFAARRSGKVALAVLRFRFHYSCARGKPFCGEIAHD
jgi:hypothetical protein